MTSARTIAANVVAAVAIILFLAVSIGSAANAVPKPKEFGVYAKTDKGLNRIRPNIVGDEGGIYYLEPNNPQRFPLGSVDYFVVNGNYQIQFITLNPMKPFQMSSVGTPRVMFGQDVEISLTKQSDTLYVVKPKGLFGRGYYAIWIDDTAWDFIIE
jgi:hypothetical protein